MEIKRREKRGNGTKNKICVYCSAKHRVKIFYILRGKIYISKSITSGLK